jgi:phosphoglycolate phosphatase
MNMLDSLTTAFFDLDGTIADPMIGITTCLQYSLKHLGRPVPSRDQLTWCIGPPLRGSFATLLETTDASEIEEAVRLYRERYDTTGIYEYERYAGVEPMLRRLKTASLTLWIVSSKAGIYLPKILKHLELDNYFAGCFGPDLAGYPDSKVTLLASVLRALPVKRDESLMIGDRALDVQAGRENGIGTVAVSYGYGTADEISEASPGIVCHSPSEVADLLCRRTMR